MFAAAERSTCKLLLVLFKLILLFYNTTRAFTV